MSAVSRQASLAEVRRAVARNAKGGTRPSVGRWKPFLDEAYDGFGGADALARLEGEAEEAMRQRAEQNRRSAERRKLESLTKQILREWDEAAEAERLALARAEAEKRLGIS